MNNKKDVNNKYGMFESTYNINKTRGAQATAYIMFYLLEIVFGSTYCDTDSIYLINNDSEGKDE